MLLQNKWTTSHAAWSGHVDVESVDSERSDVNAVEETPTALHIAQDGHVDVAKLLIQNGADVNCTEKTALHLASMWTC